jgi:hypothetical protein
MSEESEETDTRWTSHKPDFQTFERIDHENFEVCANKGIAVEYDYLECDLYKN